MNIYLAGDSIVQNYTEEEFIAGWGQFLPRFFKPDVNVFNYAKGGRSSRLFLLFFLPAITRKSFA